MQKGTRPALGLVALNAAILLAGLLAGPLSISVTGQLVLSDLNQPIYYVDQAATIGQPGPQDQLEQYLALANQLRPRLELPTLQDSLPVGSNEALIQEVLQERYNEALKQQQAKIESEKLNQQELIDALSGIKQQQQQQQQDENRDDDFARISPPVNNPLEFEATAKMLEHLPPANITSQSDLMSLDTLLSIYLNKLVKDIEDKSSKPTAAATTTTTKTSSSSSSQIDDTDESNNEIRSIDKPKQATTSSKSAAATDATAAEDTTPKSRYGSVEYIDHPLAIIGHQYVQGGAGEGKQLLGPDGTFENVQVVKSDHAVPSYCDPPNPCPIGFASEDGCLENFVNSASSSREYQAKQQCSCDNEHSLFNCASPISTLREDLFSTSTTPNQDSTSDDSTTSRQEDNDEEDNRINQQQQQQQPAGRLETLARTIQNRFGSLSSIQNLISSGESSQLN